MARVWLITLVIIDCVFGKLDGAVSDDKVGLQQSANDTGCVECPEGDCLNDLCGTRHGITCCLYRDTEWTSGLCQDIEGGDGDFLQSLLPQLPVDNITSLGLANTELLITQCDSLCVLENLQILVAKETNLEVFTCPCLSQLRTLIVESQRLTITNNFNVLNHLSFMYIITKTFLPSADSLFQLQAANELTYLVMSNSNLKELDIWPLCLTQTQRITVTLSYGSIVDFINTESPSRCNIKTPMPANSTIDLSSNAITHVSDIAIGWGFSSLHDFITSLMSENSTDFPIFLDDNPFRCDCRDVELYRMLMDSQYSIHLTNLANLTCKRPQKLEGRHFKSLLGSELDCDSPLPLPLILGVIVGGAVLLAISIVAFLF